MSDETEKQAANEEATVGEPLDAVRARSANGDERQATIDALEQIYVNKYRAMRCADAPSEDAAPDA